MRRPGRTSEIFLCCSLLMIALTQGLSLVQKISARLASQRAIRLHLSPLPLTSAMYCKLVQSALAFAGWCWGLSHFPVP